MCRIWEGVAVAEDGYSVRRLSLRYDAVVLPETHGDHHAFVCNRVGGSAPRSDSDTSCSGVDILFSERFVEFECERRNSLVLLSSRVRVCGSVEVERQVLVEVQRLCVHIHICGSRCRMVGEEVMCMCKRGG